MKRIYLILFLSLIAANLVAQEQFVAYSIKGNVTIPGKSNTIAKSGDIIPITGSVTIGENSGITLVGKDGITYSTAQTGKHSLLTFSRSFQNKNNGILNKFLKFFWQQAMNRKAGINGKNRKEYFDNYAVVVRTDFSKVWIDHQAFDTLNYSGVQGKFSIYWLSYVKAKEYEFSLYQTTNTGDAFYRTSLTGLKLPLVKLLPQIKPGNTYYWTVNVKGDEEGDLFVLNYETKNTFDSVLNLISNQKPGVEAKAEEKYRTAFVLENMHFLAEAYQNYMDALNLDPKNTLYKSTIFSFRKEFEIK